MTTREMAKVARATSIPVATGERLTTKAEFAPALRQGAAAMAPEDITIGVELNRGDASATVWTSDFSYDYVRINAEYRT